MRVAEADDNFEVVVIGGGVVGLFLAFLTATGVNGRKHVRVYDNRWTRTHGNTVRWKQNVDEWFHRLQHIVTLERSFWEHFPSDFERRLFPPGRFTRQWPLQQGGRQSCVHPRNIALHELEDLLLEAAQEEPFSDLIELLPVEYCQAEHSRVTKEQPFHAIVLADGSLACTVRDSLLTPFFGVVTAYSDCVPAEFLCISFNLGDVKPFLNVTESTVITLAQQRYFFIAQDERRGSVSIRLTDREAKEVEELCGLEAQVAVKNFNIGAIGHWALEALKLFGIPKDAVESMTRLRSSAHNHRAYHAELAGYVTPRGSDAMPHPYAFLVGKAADMVEFWPGCEFKAGIQGACSVFQNLANLQQCICAEWPVHDSMFKDHDRTMATFQAQRSRFSGHPKLFPNTLDSTPQSTSTARTHKHGDECPVRKSFLAAVRDSHQRLAQGGLPPEREQELPTVDSLLQKISHMDLSFETYRLFQNTGPWSIERSEIDGAALPWQGIEVEAPINEQADLQTGVSGVAVQQSLDKGASSMMGPGTTMDDARALFNRGVRYLQGKQVKGDDSKAAECLLQAAQQGHQQAQYAIGVMLLHGRGVKQDRRQAARWFTDAAKQGHAKAQYNLGIMCQYGVGLARDLVAASTWTMLAAEQGHKKALRSSNLIRFGAGDWMDYDHKQMGTDGILKEAQRGNKHAQYKIGVMLYTGDCVEQDKARASFWFMQAAQQGLIEAQYQISRMLFLGDGVEKDTEYAFRFLVLAAEQGHIEAQHNLGVKLYFGEGIGLDRKSAAYWFLKAANQGFPQSQNNIGWMLVIGDGVQQNVEEGRKWLMEAAARGNVEAQSHINAVEGHVITS